MPAAPDCSSRSASSIASPRTCTRGCSEPSAPTTTLPALMPTRAEMVWPFSGQYPVHVCTCMSVYIHTRNHIHTYTHTHAHTRAHAHTLTIDGLEHATRKPQHLEAQLSDRRLLLCPPRRFISTSFARVFPAHSAGQVVPGLVCLLASRVG